MCNVKIYLISLISVQESICNFFSHNDIDLCDLAEPPACVRRLLRIHHSFLHKGMNKCIKNVFSFCFLRAGAVGFLIFLTATYLTFFFCHYSVFIAFIFNPVLP